MQEHCELCGKRLDPKFTYDVNLVSTDPNGTKHTHATMYLCADCYKDREKVSEAYSRLTAAYYA